MYFILFKIPAQLKTIIVAKLNHGHIAKVKSLPIKHFAASSIRNHSIPMSNSGLLNWGSMEGVHMIFL